VRQPFHEIAVGPEHFVRKSNADNGQILLHRCGRYYFSKGNGPLAINGWANFREDEWGMRDGDRDQSVKHGCFHASLTDGALVFIHRSVLDACGGKRSFGVSDLPLAVLHAVADLSLVNPAMLY